MPTDRLSDDKATILRQGGVIPAHPLALDASRRFDARRQRALTRYYLDAGVVGIAVGVHTTQFAIRAPKVGLLRPVLELAQETVRDHLGRLAAPILTIAGVVGRTDQAVEEATLAADLGYDMILPQLGAFGDAGDTELIRHCERLAEIRPVFGFYLQPAVGGRHLSYGFWRRFCEIDNVLAIKVAPFNRYQTLDVVRAVAESGRTGDIAVYTGNDDHIVLDLLTSYSLTTSRGPETVRMVGGLLGHWAVWTQNAVDLAARVRAISRGEVPLTEELLTVANQVTESNAAFFDPGHGFRGSIAGLHEVLRRQGLLAGRWCLDPDEDLSPGQAEEIDRVYAAYPQLADDGFVAANLDRWLA